MDVLGQAQEDPLPRSGVDVPGAVRAGRRRRRRRLGAAVIGLVAVLTSGLAVLTSGLAVAPQWQGFALGSSGGGPGPGKSAEPLTCAGTPLPDPPVIAAGAGQAPAEFDVLRHWVDVDAVSGYRVEHDTTARRWQRLELINAARTSMVEIIVFPRDGHPAFASAPGTAPAPVDPSTGTPADPVGNARAYWLPGRQGLAQFEVARLGWQWAPGAWAFVAAADVSPAGGPARSVTTADEPRTQEQIAALRAVAREVAAALRVGAGARVTSPFTMPVPDCTRLVMTHLMSSTATGNRPFTRFTLTFGTDEFSSDTPLLSRDSGQTISVTADSIATPADKPGSANQTVDGHPAAGEGGFLVLHGVDGFALELTTPGGRDPAIALARTVRVMPGAAQDRSAWTPDPLAG